MKKILNIVVLTLALNFLLVVAGSVALLKTSHMDREKFTEVKKVLFDTSQPTTAPAATQPVVATTEPADRLADLLAQASGKPAGEQVDFIRQAFDTEMAELDRKRTELMDLQRQIDLARNQTKMDRSKIDQAQKDLLAAQELQTKLASDKGFQDSLELYNVMPAKQVKTIFMTLSDDTVMQYLVAMEPRSAGKIIKEFKTPEETTRIQKVLERIRQAQAPGAPGSAAAPVLQPTAPGGAQAALPQP